MESLKMEQQIQLEEEMRGLGISRYNKALSSSCEADMPPGMVLLKKSINPVSETIKQWLADMEQGNARRSGSLVKIISELGADAAAFLSLRSCINSLGMKTKFTLVCIGLGQDVQNELEFRLFQKANPDLFKNVMKKVEDSSSAHYRRTVLKFVRNKHNVPTLGWDKKTQISVGNALIEMTIAASGLFEVRVEADGKNNSISYIRGTDRVREWLSNQHNYCQILSPLYLPMVIKPNEWTSPSDGGYMTLNMDMIKTRNKNYLEELHSVQMPMVYESLNALQNTGWRINKRIYKVMADLWEMGGDKAGLPNKDGKPIPNKPLDIDTNADSLSSWRQEAKAVHMFNHRNISKITAVAQSLWTAAKFLEEPEFYYVWTLDWRGRAYPVGSFVHPQSNDTGKSLLEFSVGKSLGEQGVAWLSIQLANTWGYDKASFDDRIQWAHDHTADIMAYALDPLANRGWMEADAPFGFLAACFDWLGYQLQGESFVSHLPVQVDGSCNGLQNFSAMLKDEIGGAATNLIPSDKPKDIYQLVADEANKIIADDFANSVPVSEVFVGKITRKLTKRNTMTMPYSVTQYGMKDQLMDEFRKMEDEGKPMDFKGHDMMPCASYLAGVNYKAIGKVVVAARNAMDWLKEASKVAASDGLPVYWTNPAGLPIVQAYKEALGTKINLYFDGKRRTFTISNDGERLDSRKQAAGIAPNFVHSCDSGHMMRTLVKCKEVGLTHFSFIHDSFGTHAGDMGDLSYILREAFVEQYSQDILGAFRKELVEQLSGTGSTNLVDKLPPVPPFGSLDLSLVVESNYFFA